MSANAVPTGDNVKLAVFIIILTVFALSAGDAAIKFISSDFPLWQIFVLRSAIALPILIGVVKVGVRATALRPIHLGWTALRSAMLVAMWVTYYAALPHLALSVAAAAYYTLPLFITVFAALLLGETIGMKGWIAIAFGFLGVLLILKPQAADFNSYALLPLVSAILYAFAMILTRTRCRDEHPLVLSLALNVTFVVAGLAASAWLVLVPVSTGDGADRFLTGSWIPMAREQWLAMALLTAAVLIGSIGAAIAYQVGPPSIVATFDFAYVAFAAAWGFIVFAETPDRLTLLGMALIVGAGVLALRR